MATLEVLVIMAQVAAHQSCGYEFMSTPRWARHSCVLDESYLNPRSQFYPPTSRAPATGIATLRQSNTLQSCHVTPDPLSASGQTVIPPDATVDPVEHR